jgi:hypothetical protein
MMPESREQRVMASPSGFRVADQEDKRSCDQERVTRSRMKFTGCIGSDEALIQPFTEHILKAGSSKTS